MTVLLAVLWGASACDQLDPASGTILDAPAARDAGVLSDAGIPSDAGVSSDLSRKWDAAIGKQGGTVVITAKTAPLGKIVEGGRYELRFLVETVTLYNDLYRFSLSAIDGNGASLSDWNRGSVIIPAEAEVEIGKPLLVRATVTVPAGAQSVKLVFRADSVGGIQANAFPLRLSVGEVADISDVRVTPHFRVPWSVDPKLRDEDIVIDGTPVYSLQVVFGATGTAVAKFLVDSTAPGAGGAFRFSAEIEGSPGDWGTKLIPDHFDDLPAGGSIPVNVKLENKSGSGSRAVSYMVLRAAHLPSVGATTPDYTSWVRVPIQGYLP